MRAYLSAAAFAAAFLGWLFSGAGRDGASVARDALPDVELRRRSAEEFRGERAEPARDAGSEPAEAAPRRAVRIVYPPPYEAR
jgi:hypothetical protein